ncbi:MAG: Flp pilus assembly protein CpaB [Solirubrobacteraceae bacterium]
MTRPRRAALIIGLAVILGALAAADIGRREAELRAKVGDPVGVVVADRDLPAGEPVDAAALRVRSVPARYAPLERIERPDEAAGLRPWTAIPEGADVVPTALVSSAGPPLRPGERVTELTVVGDGRLVRPGTRVDLLVTHGEAGKGHRTEIMLENAEVLGVRAAPVEEDGAIPRLSVQLRTTQEQSRALVEAQNEAAELRVLARAPGDDREAGSR